VVVGREAEREGDKFEDVLRNHKFDNGIGTCNVHGNLDFLIEREERFRPLALRIYINQITFPD